MMAKFSGLNPKGLYVHCKFRKRITNFGFCAHQLQQAREIRKFHVAVVQQRLRNVQKSLMRVQRIFFLPISTFCFFAVRRRRCKNSLLLSSENFATMVT